MPSQLNLNWMFKKIPDSIYATLFMWCFKSYIYVSPILHEWKRIRKCIMQTFWDAQIPT